jgi:Zn-dependent protease with chaperone function
MMSSQELIAQAQQGQPGAIAALINQSLKSKGIQATVNWAQTTLQVLLTLSGNVSYSEEKLVSIIRRGLMVLQVPQIQQVMVYAKLSGEAVPLWSRQFAIRPAALPPLVKDRPAVIAPPPLEVPIDHTIPPRRSYLDPNAYRADGELIILIVSILVIVGIGVIVSQLNLLLFIVAMPIIAVMIKVQQSQYLGSAVRIQAHQFPEIYQAAQTAANRLAMPMPDIFLLQSPEINAFAMGVLGRRKTVVLHSALVEAMSWDEIVYTLGHEFSHIKCSHTIFTIFTSGAGAIKIPVLSQFMGLVFLFWLRKCEYTCDRGGIIANQNLEAGITALAKLAVGRRLFHKMDIPALRSQKQEVDRNGLSQLSQMFESHPYITYRIHALDAFYQSSKYRRCIVERPHD